jgi:hypothetical protein
VVLSVENYQLQPEFNGTPPSSAVAENAASLPLLHSYEIEMYFTVPQRKPGLHQFQAVIVEVCPSVPTVISYLRPSKNLMYHRFYESTNYK